MKKQIRKILSLLVLLMVILCIYSKGAKYKSEEDIKDMSIEEQIHYEQMIF